MRKPFFDDSRLAVVLYREPWGKTPWTRVEETAIKEGCLEHGWQRLFFMVLDRASALPRWLPQHHVRFNYADFGLEQAVGAIKARAQENGGQHLPLTAMKRAELFEAEKLFLQDKSRMNSEEGIKTIVSKVGDLFQHIEKRCADINAQGSLQVRCGKNFQERNAIQFCSMTDGRVGLTVTWHQQWSNVLDRSALIIREYNGGLILPAEEGQRMYLMQPERLKETRYSPDLSLAREYGWRQDESTEFLSSSALAERCVIEFLDLASRYARGEIKNRMLY